LLFQTFAFAIEATSAIVASTKTNVNQTMTAKTAEGKTTTTTNFSSFLIK
jgi:hypothetical protein